MKILIVGAGVVGRQLARDLSGEKHDVTLVEQDETLLSGIKGNLDVLCLQGDGTRLSILKKAGIKGTELVIAATRSDEANAIICLLADKFGVPRKIARIRNDDWFRSGLLSEKEFAIDKVINLDQSIVGYVRKIVTTPGLVDISYFNYTGISLLGFRVHKSTPLAGKKLSEISQTFSLAPFLFATIYRKGEMFIPDGEDVIEAGDICYILTGEDMVPFILPIFNKSLEPMTSIIIYGANNTGLSLARELEKIVPRVTLIEPNERKAMESAEKLLNTRVIHGDPQEQEVLDELDMPSVGCFISVGADPKSNILTSLLMKEEGVRKVIIVTDDTEYVPVLDAIGLDVLINPKLITAGEMLRYIRKGKVYSVAKLKTGGVEMMEIEIVGKSKVTGKPLHKMHFPKDILVGGTVEEGNIIFATGDTVLSAGQKVIIIFKSEALPVVEKLFQ